MLSVPSPICRAVSDTFDLRDLHALGGGRGQREVLRHKAGDELQAGELRTRHRSGVCDQSLMIEGDLIIAQGMVDRNPAHPLDALAALDRQGVALNE